MTSEIPGAINDENLDIWKDSAFWINRPKKRDGPKVMIMVANKPMGTINMLESLKNSEHFSADEINDFSEVLLGVNDRILRYCDEGGFMTTKGEIVLQGEELQLSDQLSESVNKQVMLVRPSSHFLQHFNPEIRGVLLPYSTLILLKKGFSNHLAYSQDKADRLWIVLVDAGRKGVDNMLLDRRVLNSCRDLIGDTIDKAGIPRMISPKSVALQLMVDASISRGARYVETSKVVRKGMLR